MSEQLRRERHSLKLVSCCEDCEHFVADDGTEVARVGQTDGQASGRGSGGCDLLYPTAPHRRAAWDAARDGDEVSFCKMFEAL